MNSNRNLPGAVVAGVIALIALIAAAPVHAQSALDGLDVPITGGEVDKIMVDDRGRIMMGGNSPWARRRGR